MHLFSFESKPIEGKAAVDCLVVFLGLEDPDAATIDDAYVAWTSVNVPPPLTLIIGCIGPMREFYAQYRNEHGRYRGLDRLHKHGDIKLYGFSHTGDIFEISDKADGAEVITPLYYAMVQSFVAQQIQEADIVIPAPPSIYFDKLSTRFSSHFIRAEALLQSTTCIELLALYLLKPFHDWYSSSIVSASGTISIFLDTMGIWPIAEKLSQLHQHGNPKQIQYRIESFKSYEGFNEWNPPKRPAFVIISATTSGGLAERVSEKIGAANAEIWTVMTLAPSGQVSSDKNDESPKKSIFELPRKLVGRPSLDGLRSEFQTDISSIPPGAETISIVGERFLSQPVKPKRVRLAHKSLDEQTKKTLVNLAKKSVVKVARGRFDAQSRWSISFDFAKLIEMACSAVQAGQNSLLKEWLRNYSSPSPIAIIYPSAEGTSAQDVTKAASELAKRTEDVLRELTPGVEVFILSSDDLAKSSKPRPHELKRCSVIVVSPVIGNGFVFKQISALLRHEQPTGPRLFLALAALPDSQAHFDQLKSDISLNLPDRRYEFKYQFVIPIGRLDTNVQWSSEIELLEELAEEVEDFETVAPVVATRTQVLLQYQVLEDRSIFLPSANQTPLLLSTGFFLWPGSSEIGGDNYGGAVFLSIAALLQATRVAASKSDDTSLKTGLFQHALICPEMFTRFNDSIIQAAILRAAYSSELNYGVSPEMSHDMERLLLKWIKYFDQPAGAAMGEFLMAIALGKLKLRKDHMLNVLNHAKALPGWVGVLAGIAEKRVA